MEFKNLTDACMSLLNNNRIADVFINDGYVEVKAIADHNSNDQIKNSKQLERALKNTLYIPKAAKVCVDHATRRKGYRFWNVSLED